jgi:hypothetical protein
VNDAIGRAAVRLSLRYLRRRYRRELRVGLGLAMVALLAGGFLATRNPREG